MIIISNNDHFIHSFAFLSNIFACEIFKVTNLFKCDLFIVLNMPNTKRESISIQNKYEMIQLLKIPVKAFHHLEEYENAVLNAQILNTKQTHITDYFKN